MNHRHSSWNKISNWLTITPHINPDTHSQRNSLIILLFFRKKNASQQKKIDCSFETWRQRERGKLSIIQNGVENIQDFFNKKNQRIFWSRPVDLKERQVSMIHAYVHTNTQRAFRCSSVVYNGDFIFFVLFFLQR